jgi:hypothetical protein
MLGRFALRDRHERRSAARRSLSPGSGPIPDPVRSAVSFEIITFTVRLLVPGFVSEFVDRVPQPVRVGRTQPGQSEGTFARFRHSPTQHRVQETPHHFGGLLRRSFSLVVVRNHGCAGSAGSVHDTGGELLVAQVRTGTCASMAMSRSHTPRLAPAEGSGCAARTRMNRPAARA